MYLNTLIEAFGNFVGGVAAMHFENLGESEVFEEKFLDVFLYRLMKEKGVKRKINGKTIQLFYDKKEVGYNKELKKIVLDQAKLANKAKLDAIVCSPMEVNFVKKVFKKEIITPGIRFNSEVDDQKRTLTPKQAYKNGSDWLVIGRPITKGNIKNNLQNLINHLK